MKKFTSILLSLMLLLSVTACGNENASAPSEKAENNSENTAASSEPSELEASNPETSSQEAKPEDETEALIRVAALKGPTGMGLASMLTSEEGKALYELTLCASPSEIAPLVMQGNVDLASLPSNLGAKFSQKVSVIAVNTVGNLTFVTKNVEINEFADLKGQTVLTSGKGASPEAMLNFLLEKNGMKAEEDVKVEYMSEHAECLASLLKAESGVALLPQPFATVALTKDESLKTALDFNELWKEATDGVPPVTGIMVASRDFLANHKDKVDAFLAEYKNSMELAANADDKAVEAIAALEIAPAPIAKKALPSCGIQFITGEEMKATLSSYLEILNAFEPKLIGEKMPADDFYYLG